MKARMQTRISATMVAAQLGSTPWGVLGWNSTSRSLWNAGIRDLVRMVSTRTDAVLPESFKDLASSRMHSVEGLIIRRACPHIRSFARGTTHLLQFVRHVRDADQLCALRSPFLLPSPACARFCAVPSPFLVPASLLPPGAQLLSCALSGLLGPGSFGSTGSGVGVVPN